MTAATVTSKGQVTIPADIRKSFDIAAGDQIVFYKALDGDLRLHVRKLVKGSGQGVLSSRGQHVSVAEMDAGIANEITRKHRRRSQS